jgi:hypothetical protein
VHIDSPELKFIPTAVLLLISAFLAVGRSPLSGMLIVVGLGFMVAAKFLSEETYHRTVGLADEDVFHVSLSFGLLALTIAIAVECSRILESAEPPAASSKVSKSD